MSAADDVVLIAVISSKFMVLSLFYLLFVLLFYAYLYWYVMLCVVRVQKLFVLGVFMLFLL